MPTPAPSEWLLWQTVLQQALSLGHNLALPIPLGKWKNTGKPRTGWMYNEDENALYHSMSTSLTRHSMIPRQSRTHYFHGKGDQIEEKEIPTGAKVVMVAKIGMWLMLTGIGEMVTTPKHTSNAWQKMETTTLGTEWNLQIKSTGSMDKIREAIQAKKAIAVSDGSYQNDTGACAWIIEGLSSEHCIEGLMETPGSPGDHSSFRSKAVGQYGLLLTLYLLLNNH